MASNVTDLTAEQASKSLTTVMRTFKQGIGDVANDLNSFNQIQNQFRKL